MPSCEELTCGAVVPRRVYCRAGIDCVVFDDVQANPTMSIVEAGIAVLNSMPAGTFLVSLGGGSSMDAAKAISVIGPDGGVTAEDIAQY